MIEKKVVGNKKNEKCDCMRFINCLAFCIEHLGADAKPPPCRVRAQNTIKNGRQDNQLLVPFWSVRQ